MSLFQKGSFELHSGTHSDWKIECDNISNDEMEILAKLIAERVEPFSRVASVSEDLNNPAARLRGYLAYYASSILETETWLLVDDVFTTGSSMSTALRHIEESYALIDRFPPNIIGAVIFARTEPFGWITPLFSIAPRIREIQDA